MLNIFFLRPPFVQIVGFHVSYDEFYESFKQRGKIDNNVMSLWTYQFNLDEAEIRKEDNNVVKKYAFLSHHCKFLNFCSSFFVNLFDHLPMHLQCSKQYFCVLQG